MVQSPPKRIRLVVQLLIHLPPQAPHGLPPQDQRLALGVFPTSEAQKTHG